ncbi:hypothetical protein RQM47_01390 [Rubrivirga sp. S365]|uniref:DUF4295 domain-containing protein n=1 Tax=Rubrivirga litoralis TaxID=3075598 RepID=A0ABU3BRW8_9BACT|nr:MULTISPECIES: hypothetical protein [unclassified Rubrivirga]MDT0632018.1 hypothetical protein [Rubrivirga sp. F394]MDT7855289.1 hypothetical protein [Rubrivirga sp. S365]
MAKKVSKNQRTNRGAQEAKQMAKIIVSSKKQNGQFEFRSKMVEAGNVQDELKAAQAA